MIKITIIILLKLQVLSSRSTKRNRTGMEIVLLIFIENQSDLGNFILFLYVSIIHCSIHVFYRKLLIFFQTESYRMLGSDNTDNNKR